MIIISLVFQLLWCLSTIGQQVGIADIPFTKNDKTLDLAFVGGLRAPQISTADLNVDGREDIIIYDRDGSLFLPMIRKSDGTLRYDPSFQDIFPKVRSWALLRDYDGDGIKDIFCSPVEIGIPGIEVYKGSITDGLLSFNLVRFPTKDFDILYIPIGNTETQAYVSIVDIPDIRDIDDDGDLDVVAFEPSGSTISFYRNMSTENGFGADSLIYILSDNCFGGMVESGFSQEVNLSPEPGGCASFFWEGDDIFASSRHSGSTILAMDVTGDNLKELILGDISYDGLVMLTNTGTLEEAYFTDQNVRFPAGTDPADIELYLAGYHEDIDDDGIKELIVAPNDRFSSQSTDHIWVYDITSEEGMPKEFTLRTKNFLVEEMIYPGPNSAPMFFDYNEDGLIDLLIGTGGLSSDGIEVDPRLILYENVGTTSTPKYSLASDDYLEMSEFSTTSRSFAPSIGDLEGDGDLDMIIGDNTGRLYFVENESGSESVLQFKRPVYDHFNIKVSAFATPFIYDYNRDGLGDLIVGEQNFNSFEGKRGSINYFQNTGSVGAADFDADEEASPNDPIFGRINLKESGFINNFSSPSIIDLKDDVLISSGTASGFISIHQTVRESPLDSFSVLSTRYGNIKVGEQTMLSFADLDDDMYLEVAIGNRRGGLAIYHTDIFLDFGSPTYDISISDRISISPNPAYNFINIDIEDVDLSNVLIYIHDSAGKRVLQIDQLESEMDISSLNDGVYYVEIRTPSVVYTSKFVVVGK